MTLRGRTLKVQYTPDPPVSDPSVTRSPSLNPSSVVDRLARPKDDLFDNSTMTFGEHLEELRHSLVRALIWLGVGLAIGLIFANRVVAFVADPLEVAIQGFRADRDLTRLGYDPTDEEVKPLRRFLSDHALVWEIVYDIPEDVQKMAQELVGADGRGAAAGNDGESEGEGGDPPAKEKSSAAGGDSSGGDTSGGDTSGGDSGATENLLDARSMAELLTALPDPSTLQPRLQLRESKEGLGTFKVEESFMIWIKAGLIVGAVISSPMVFYHLWSFVAAGLYSHERRYVYLYLPASVTLFVAGVVLAFFFVLNYVLSFLLTFNASMDVAVEPRLTYYVNFVLLLPLGFGIAFQLPLVMLFLQRIGIVETEQYVSSWRIAVLVIFLLSMILTPADVTSMVSLAVPLMVLYFLGILMCKYIPRGRGLGSAAYDPA